MKRPTVKTEGFTLIELLIVVVILSTLAAIVVPQFANSSDSARIAATKSSLSGIRSALDTYRNDNGHYPLEVALARCATTVAWTTNLEKITSALTLYSDNSGESCDTKSAAHPNGPYLRAREFPGNPLDSNLNTIAIDTGSTLGLGNDGSAAAWLYRPNTGEFIANQATYDKF